MKFEEIYQHDVFATEAGIVIKKLDEESAVLEVVVEARHLNAGQMAHGGLIFMLCDMAMAARANLSRPTSVSLQSAIRYLTAAKEGDTLTAIAVEVHARYKLYNSSVEVFNQHGVKIAVADGMFHTKRSDKFPTEAK